MMPKTKVHYMGLLANTDSSILKVDLEDGFKIEEKSDKEAVDLVCTFDGLSPNEASRELHIWNRCINISEKKAYFISNYKELNKYEDPDIKGFTFIDLASYSSEVENYLIPVIQLMRLFKEGNICIPREYYYHSADDGTLHAISRMWTKLRVLDGPYTLQSSELQQLQAFIKNTKLPFGEPSLQLAFENFELSYQIFNPHLAFLSLMMSLETLLNRDQGETRYRISRNAAVLLGKNKEEAEMIFSEVRDLYGKRSKLVHTGKRNSIASEDLRKLRYYVRESIKEVYKTGKTKDELLDLLNSCGFGEKPWTR